MTENDVPRGNDALQSFAKLVAANLAHMAGGMDRLEEQLEKQAKADDKRHAEQTRAEERRLEVYEDRWQTDHDDMTRLVAELGNVQASLKGWVVQFQTQLDRIDSVQRESRRTDAIIAAITAIAMAAIVVLAK